MRSIDPSRRYVNDTFGPNRSQFNKRKLASTQNVVFEVVNDSGGHPHVFWVVTRDIEPNCQLLGDYADEFWSVDQSEACEGDDVPEQVIVRRLLFAVEGSSGRCPIHLLS